MFQWQPTDDSVSDFASSVPSGYLSKISQTMARPRLNLHEWIGSSYGRIQYRLNKHCEADSVCHLCKHCLQPLLSSFGQPLTIQSGRYGHKSVVDRAASEWTVLTAVLTQRESRAEQEKKDIISTGSCSTSIRSFLPEGIMNMSDM